MNGECFYNNPFEPTPGAGQGAVAFTMDSPAVYPDYLTDPATLLCPSDSNLRSAADGTSGLWYNQEVLAATGEAQWDPCAFTPESYIYLAWVFTDDPGRDYLAPGANPNDSSVNAANIVGNFVSLAFITAFTTQTVPVARGFGDYDTDISGGSVRVPRVREWAHDHGHQQCRGKPARRAVAVMYDFTSTVPGLQSRSGRIECCIWTGTWPS